MAQIMIGSWLYKQIQINGERITMNLSFQWCLLTDLNPAEIFISRIPFNMYEDDLIPLFEMVGPVAQFRLMMSHSGRNRGFGYVIYADSCDAYRAIANLNNIIVSSNCKLQLSVSENLRYLWLGNVSNNFDVDAVINKILERVDPVEISISQQTGQMHYFMKFRTHRDAAISRRLLIRDVGVFGIRAWINWEGIVLLEDLTLRHADGNRDYIYYLAIGNARLKQYSIALKYLKAFLQVEPNNLQVITLQEHIKKKMEREGMIGMAVAGGAALVLGGLVGIAMAMARK